MSGGVDSSVAAALLKEKGYEVTGVFMKNWADPSFFKDKTMCPWVNDQEDARKAAGVLGIPFYTFNFEKEYRARVVRYMLDGYKKGITPNPDVMCNKEIKFGVFLKKALGLGADFVATGHYARRREIKNQKSKIKIHELLAGADLNKDQSYFLWTLTQKQLARTLFPIGEYEKPEVRAMAKKFGLANAEKKDSQGLCFVGEVDVHDFLKSKIKPKRGKIITIGGKEVGEHEGAMFYTIGQRHGIGSPGGGTAYYVTGKDMKKNILYVAEGKEDKSLYKNELTVVGARWILGVKLKLPLECQARIRYRQPLQEARITNYESPKESKLPTGQVRIKNKTIIHNSKFIIRFKEPQRAVTPGQSVVFYDGDTVLGGGSILNV